MTDKEIDRRWAVLARECRLLKDAAGKMVAGNLDYAGPVSLCLRKLVGDGKGNHILQDCASFEERALLVRMPKRPDEWRTRVLREQVIEQQPKPSNPTARKLPSPVETDLDEWLSIRSTVLASRRLSPMDMIRIVADKIGAHADLRGNEVLEAMEKNLQMEVPQLVQLLNSIGKVVWDRAKQLAKECGR